MTPDFLSRWIIPAALSLLPASYDTPAARRILIAIALQESGCKARRQSGNGPARSFWQFETIGVQGLLMRVDKGDTGGKTAEAAKWAGIQATPEAIHSAIEHNDVLAATCARLLLYTHPLPLPDDMDGAWSYYLKLWRPGKPRPDHWRECWAEALELVP